ncbi:MAG: hypothetical protein A2Y20_04920 [Firmicutes bacterium GWF2_51_9]|nr:MAG: hypothetical protein A2Y20_04920 [Firmicutes bacterium GWF2_51_9]OGS57406.1 MAG: hypothetical protein A2Y19_02775 [Firmicutes bacterium GWE2_51_13]HAM63147.1 DNA (cytosine-5-)-methyltransferase [Erysipelotrichaceae bacterium]HBZ41525.1 DNA (cytosine-5-)-methyltransferase [Erysipelotrichaceae bacterium]
MYQKGKCDDMRFIDLFCGVGGFHQGIRKVVPDAKCIFACDNDYNVAKIYTSNYDIESFYDIKNESTHELINQRVIENQSVDLLVAGFPCQSFSKAGKQLGFDDETKGTLFFEVEKIIKRHKPKYVLLENVRNLKSHDGGATWAKILSHLKVLYEVDSVIIGPNDISNIPALRDRVFIICYRKDIVNSDFSYLSSGKHKRKQTSIYRDGILDPNYFDKGESNLEPDKIKIIEMWESLRLKLMNSNVKIISPVWTKYFEENLDLTKVPEWKKKIIVRNQEFYLENRELIDNWIEENFEFFSKQNDSNKKFEWNAGDAIHSIWEGIIQFRPSGVRVKKPDFLPTFVAINQTPILGVEKRYIRPIEMARLYGFDEIDFLNQPINETYKQLGNTVSVDVVEHLIRIMLRNGGDINE